MEATDAAFRVCVCVCECVCVCVCVCVSGSAAFEPVGVPPCLGGIRSVDYACRCEPRTTMDATDDATDYTDYGCHG